MAIEPRVAARFHLLEGMERRDSALANPEQARRFAEFNAPSFGESWPLPVTVRDDVVPGRNGAINVRIYSPDAAAPSGAGLVWLHGGGFGGGSLDMPEADRVSREICHRARATVVSVGYRLAVGGIHYPVPHEDVVDAWRWTVRNAEQLDIEPSRLCLGGASAGANLAAGAAVRLRDERDARPPDLLVLAYPALHAKLPPCTPELAARMELLPQILRLQPGVLTRMFTNYYGAALDDVPPYVSPADAELAGLPRALVITCEYDDLSISGEVFAQKLAAADVECAYEEVPGMLHGHLNGDFTLPGVERTLALISSAIEGRQQ